MMPERREAFMVKTANAPENDNLAKLSSVIIPHAEDVVNMTADEIDARLGDIEGEIYEIEERLDEDNFCDDCEYIRIYEDTEEYWGRKVIREIPVCDADFCPYGGGCPRADEYDALQEKLESLQAECKRLSALYDIALEREKAYGA